MTEPFVQFDDGRIELFQVTASADDYVGDHAGRTER